MIEKCDVIGLNALINQINTTTKINLFRVPTFWNVREFQGMSGNFVLTGMSGNFDICQGIFMDNGDAD